MYRRSGASSGEKYYTPLTSPSNNISPNGGKILNGSHGTHGDQFCTCHQRQSPYFGLRPGTIIRFLLAILCLESLFIVSTLFSQTLLCDDIRLSLENARHDYERVQLVVETLTLSCNESEYDECMKTVQKSQSKYLNARIDFGKKLKTISAKLETCQDEIETCRKASLATSGHSGVLFGPEPMPADRNTNVQDEDATWLAIGIPTVRRKDGVDYLSETLNALVPHLPVVQADPLYLKIRVVVMNMNPGDHPAFLRNREFFGNSQWADYFDFVDNVDRVTATPIEAYKRQKEERKRIMESGSRAPKPPGGRVQQQSRDVVSLMRYALDSYQPSYYLFMEDDFRMCSNGIEVSRYLINRATQFNNNWIAIRASFGLNGVYMHGEDLESFAEYVERHQARRPPDHLATEWFAGETPEAAKYKKNRTHIGFRFNIFEHFGVVSSLRRGPHKQQFPGCWEPLKESAVFTVESFKSEACPSNDIWPCVWDKRCNPRYQICFPNGTKTSERPPQRIPWEIDALQPPGPPSIVSIN